MLLPPDDPRLTWRGLVEFEDAGDDWRRPWRLPSRETVAAVAGSGRERHLDARARDAAGVRLDVVVDGDLVLWLRGQPESPVDVLVDGVLVDRVRVDGWRDIRVSGLDAARVEIWLPQFGHVEVGPVEVEALGPPPGHRRWVAYGSSITQCRGAAGPSETWPALVARELDWDVTNLGFGGECHLDDVAATTIAARPLDVLSLCVGVNIHGHATFSESALLPAAVGFLETARARRAVPTLLVGPILSPDAEDRRNELGLTLSRVREIVRRAADITGVEYLDGRELLGRADRGLLADGVHPTAEGYAVIARRMAPVLAALAGPGSGAA